MLVADPRSLIREGLVALVEKGPYHVVAQCQDGEEVLLEAAHKKPAIVLLDMHLAKLSTLLVVRKLSQINSLTRIAVLTSGSDSREIMESLRVGVHGILLATSTAINLFEGFAHMMSGGTYLAPQLPLDKLLRHIQNDELVDPITTLSAREHQVFAMLVEGIRAKEIAGLLQLSPKTIDTYRAKLMRKLGIHDVAGLVKLSLRLKLTTLPGEMAGQSEEGLGSSASGPSNEGY